MKILLLLLCLGWTQAFQIIVNAPEQKSEPGITFCSTPKAIYKNTKTLLMPDPPKRGQPLTVSINGFLTKPVTQGATAKVTVKLGVIKLFEDVVDVCEQLKTVQVDCPLPAGPLAIERTVDIPKEVPPGHYLIHVQGETVEMDEIACMNADLRLAFI